MKTEHFNGLTEAESERLTILAEECAEIIQAVCKIQRHGYESVNPKLPPLKQETNRAALERELGDLQHAMVRCMDAQDINSRVVAERARSKPAHIGPHLHHQRPEVKPNG